jgi:pimeloyl-ACP methyl ester carboxylesterase
MKLPARPFRYYVRLIAFVPFAMVLAVWGVGAYQGFVGVYEILHPQRNVFCCDTPLSAGYNFEDVVLTTQDGLSLSAWYLPDRNQRAVILAHGAGGNRGQLWQLGRELNDNGYGVMLLDLRAHGESSGDTFTQGWLDFFAAVEFLQTRDIKHIGAYGFSLGANMALQAASLSPAIEAIVVDGPSPVVLSDFTPSLTLSGLLYIPYDVVYWLRLESLSEGRFAAMSNHQAVGLIAPRPMFFIAAGAEPSGFEEKTVRSFYDVAKNISPDTVQFWLIEDVFHGGGLANHTNEYLRHVLSFFESAWAS